MSDTKTHWKKLHNPDYIGAYAFQPGEETILTIRAAGVEMVAGAGGKKEECMVVQFVEKVKPLICNVTNSKAISKVANSPYIEDWCGVKICLFVLSVNAFGEEVEAVRVRPKTPKTEKTPLTPDSPKWDAAKQSLANKETTIDHIKKHYILSTENEKLLKGEQDA